MSAISADLPVVNLTISLAVCFGISGNMLLEDLACGPAREAGMVPSVPRNDFRFFNVE